MFSEDDGNLLCMTRVTKMMEIFFCKTRVTKMMTKMIDDGNLLLYDNGDKVNPLEPLRRGTKVGEKWQNGLQASKPRQIVRKVSAKGSKSFHEIKIKLLGELMNLELAQINLRT